MIAKIGWNNIWRKKGRSLIVISSVAMGIWVGLFFGAFQWGTYVQKFDDLVNRELGHIQIHNPAFIEEEYDYNFPIKDPLSARAILENAPEVKSFVERSVFSASLGVLGEDPQQILVYGVDTVEERSVYSITSMIVEGEMPLGKRKPSVLMGKKLADKIGIKLGQNVNVQGGLLHGSKSFVGRVRGFYESPNKMKDELLLYVHKADVEARFKTSLSHEFSIVLNEIDSIPSFKSSLRKSLPGLEVLSWGELMPEIEEGIEMMDAIMFIFMMIIWFALALGIVNTMLMSVLERTGEFGMLMAIGMGRKKIVSLIFFETSVLTLIGVPIGLFLTYVTVAYFGSVGIDFSSVNSTIEDFGYSSIVYPVMKNSFYVQVIFQVILVALVSTIFPALRAINLNPVQAIRKN